MRGPPGEWPFTSAATAITAPLESVPLGLGGWTQAGGGEQGGGGGAGTATAEPASAASAASAAGPLSRGATAPGSPGGSLNRAATPTALLD